MKRENIVMFIWDLGMSYFCLHGHETEKGCRNHLGMYCFYPYFFPACLA